MCALQKVLLYLGIARNKLDIKQSVYNGLRDLHHSAGTTMGSRASQSFAKLEVMRKKAGLI